MFRKKKKLSVVLQRKVILIHKLSLTYLFPGLTMPIFGETPSPYDEAVEKVTAETATTENWTLILDICDRVVADQNKGESC